MHKSMMVALLAGAASLSACTDYGSDRTVASVGTGAAVGAAGGAAVGAIVPGVSIAEGAVVGAVIGGLAGAVWADQNNDGYVDGYVQNGQYHTGLPQGYDPGLRRVAMGPMGAVMPGAPVAGLAGAIWADNNGDGQVDGYFYNGQYHPGAPQGYQPSGYQQPMPAPVPPPPPAPVSPPPARGERG